jgi:diguanylate cyclase (GGDEF)-like protein
MGTSAHVRTAHVQKSRSQAEEVDVISSVRDGQRGIRQAAAFFALGAVVSFVGNRMPGAPHRGLAADMIALADLLVAVLAWVAPWERWPRQARLLLVGFGLALIAVPSYLGLAPTYSYGACFAVLFAWVGMTQAPGTSLLVAPFAAVAYLAPLLASPGDHPDAVRSAAITLPICVLIAEIVARTVAQLDQACAESDRRAALLRVLAERDELTGVGNRRHASALLETLVPGDAVLMIDLDLFKAINDHSGHSAGDEVLQELGAYLQGALRDADLVARYGGEEFLVVLRDARDGATVAGNRLLRGWRARRPRTTFSGGVAVHEEATTPAVTLTRADLALYEAKRAGRDTVCCYQELGQLYDVGMAI